LVPGSAQFDLAPHADGADPAPSEQTALANHDGADSQDDDHHTPDEGRVDRGKPLAQRWPVHHAEPGGRARHDGFSAEQVTLWNRVVSHAVARPGIHLLLLIDQPSVKISIKDYYIIHSDRSPRINSQ
jgi:hypothetical protein